QGRRRDGTGAAYPSERRTVPARGDRSRAGTGGAVGLYRGAGGGNSGVAGNELPDRAGYSCRAHSRIQPILDHAALPLAESVRIEGSVRFVVPGFAAAGGA